MRRLHESEYGEKRNPYFHTEVDDIFIFLPLKTPTGRWSKYYATLKVNYLRQSRRLVTNP